MNQYRLGSTKLISISSIWWVDLSSQICLPSHQSCKLQYLSYPNTERSNYLIERKIRLCKRSRILNNYITCHTLPPLKEVKYPHREKNHTLLKHPNFKQSHFIPLWLISSITDKLKNLSVSKREWMLRMVIVVIVAIWKESVCHSK